MAAAAAAAPGPRPVRSIVTRAMLEVRAAAAREHAIVREIADLDAELADATAALMRALEPLRKAPRLT